MTFKVIYIFEIESQMGPANFIGQAEKPAKKKNLNKLSRIKLEENYSLDSNLSYISFYPRCVLGTPDNDVLLLRQKRMS